jgi:hypothetical protein
MKFINFLIGQAISTVMFFAFIPSFFICKKKRFEYIWGTTPILNNKYWSNAITKTGLPSKTFMSTYYSINKKTDYDLYFNDVIPLWVWPAPVKKLLTPYFAFLYILQNAKVVHLTFQGGPLGPTMFWRLEAYLFRWNKIKTIVIPYGGDAYMYSRVKDPCLQNALLISYPEAAKNESNISKRVIYWTKHANAMLTGQMSMEGMGRWDVCVTNSVCIDIDQWKTKTSYSPFDGLDGIVKILHTPNHRGFKGTEYLIQAIEELKIEGYRIDLILLENVSNDKVRETMQNVDILAEQFIFGYALSGIEGMASGLPVMSNLDSEIYTRIFRRYSHLNECPILSTTPETLKKNLKVLITKPKLREELGRAGRLYVDKYHSYETAQYLFGSIYKRIVHGQDIDLINLFHPLLGAYNKQKAIVKHPLVENRLPLDYAQ